MTDTTADQATPTIAIRAVHRADRVELHAETCGCRVPSSVRPEDVHHYERTVVSIVATHDEAIELNDGPSPVKPCLRKVLRCASCGFGAGRVTGALHTYTTTRVLDMAPTVGTTITLCDDCASHDDPSDPAAVRV